MDMLGVGGRTMCAGRRGGVRLTRRGRAVVMVVLLLLAGVGLVLAAPVSRGW